MKIPTAAPRVHVWEKRRPSQETVRIEVELRDGGFSTSPSFEIRVGWRPFRGRHFRFPGDGIRNRESKADERNAIVFAMVTREEIEEAVGEFVAKIADLKIPEPVTPPDLRAACHELPSE